MNYLISCLVFLTLDILCIHTHKPRWLIFRVPTVLLFSYLAIYFFNKSIINAVGDQ